ncbi:hypothetical protein [Leifsonia sp. 1010]|uniref:hypothetical protein n=1 Tax=Leifsonia sp. 1010 TaxID=2817769 RepID=UPI0028613242|nr:hypothetical protein [Leifsonia sp. 1010]MDR6613606.1 hypothetical protein [Leifsonia sp. 1010]
MPRHSEMENGQIWAYRESPSKPLQRVRILDKGTHYDAYIRGELIDLPGRPQTYARRPKYRCQWDRLEEYLERQKELAERIEAERAEEQLRRDEEEAAKWDGFKGLNVTVPDLIAVAMGNTSVPRIAYSIEAAADECGMSPSMLKVFINNGALKVHYANSKTIILADDLKEWIERLPTERI